MDYNDNWTLLRYNPVDYVVDGYILVNNKKITGFQREKDEIFKEKLIRLKGYCNDETDMLPISDLKKIINVLDSKYNLIQVELKSETIAYIGRAIFVDDKTLRLNTLTPEGKKGETMVIDPDNIRFIQFDNDYINSLKLFIRRK